MLRVGSRGRSVCAVACPCSCVSVLCVWLDEDVVLVSLSLSLFLTVSVSVPACPLRLSSSPTGPAKPVQHWWVSTASARAGRLLLRPSAYHMHIHMPTLAVIHMCVHIALLHGLEPAPSPLARTSSSSDEDEEDKDDPKLDTKKHTKSVRWDLRRETPQEHALKTDCFTRYRHEDGARDGDTALHEMAGVNATRVLDSGRNIGVRGVRPKMLQDDQRQVASAATTPQLVFVDNRPPPEGAAGLGGEGVVCRG